VNRLAGNAGDRFFFGENKLSFVMGKAVLGQIPEGAIMVRLLDGNISIAFWGSAIFFPPVDEWLK
jgi:hypothetical protein